MTAQCRKCGGMIYHIKKIRCVDCPKCGTYDTLEKIKPAPAKQ